MPLSKTRARPRSNLGQAPKAPLATLTIVGRCTHTGDKGYVIASNELAMGGKVIATACRQGLCVSAVSPDEQINKDAFKILKSGEAGLKNAKPTAQSALSTAAKSDPKARTRQVVLVSQDGQSAIYTGRTHKTLSEKSTEKDVAIASVGLKDASHLSTAVQRFTKSEAKALLLSERLMETLIHAGQDNTFRSVGLYIVDETNFPVVDLRVDNDPTPIIRLNKIFAEYMRDDVKLDAFLPSKDHPTGFAPSSIDETLRWLRRYVFKIRDYLDKRSKTRSKK